MAVLLLVVLGVLGELSVLAEIHSLVLLAAADSGPQMDCLYRFSSSLGHLSSYLRLGPTNAGEFSAMGLLLVPILVASCRALQLARSTCGEQQGGVGCGAIRLAEGGESGLCVVRWIHRAYLLSLVPSLFVIASEVYHLWVGLELVPVAMLLVRVLLPGVLVGGILRHHSSGTLAMG